MRYAVSTRRSAAAGGFCVLLLMALLAMLYAGFTTDSSAAPACEADVCLAHVGPRAVSGPARTPCDPADPVLTPTGGAKQHPGSGARRISHATACHLRHHVPTGSGGKAIGDPPDENTLAAPGGTASWAVTPAAPAGTPQRTAVLRC